MATKKAAKYTSSTNNVLSLQGYENSLDDWVLNIASNHLATDLVNEQRFDEYNFQNQLANFQMEELLRAYNHSANIYGLNQQAIDMEVAFQTDQIYNNADARLQELAYLQQDLDYSFAKDSIELGFQSANNSLLMKINEEETVRRNRQFGADMKAESIKRTDEKAQARRDLLKSRLKTQQEVGQAAASGRRGQSARLLEQSIETVAAVDHYAIYSQLERGEGSFKNVTSSKVDQKKSSDYIAERQRDKLVNDEKKIAQLFGLTVEQYEADTEKLGQMMIDTYTGIDSQLARLAQQEFISRVELYSKMPLPPRMAPRAKPPRRIPYDKLAKPTAPVRYPYKAIGFSSQPKQSGLSKALGIAGLVAAGVGTVLTAGAAAPLAAGAAGAAGATSLAGITFGSSAAAYGLGFTSAGSILQGLSGATY